MINRKYLMLILLLATKGYSAPIPSGNGVLGTATSGNVTPALPVGWQANDIHICVITSGDNVHHSMPAGWTNINQSSSTINLTQSIWWRRAVGGDAAPLVTHTAGDGICARIFGFRGCVTSGTPYSAQTIRINASATTVTSSGVTPSSGEFVIFIGGASNADTSTALIFSALSGTNPTFTYNDGLTDHVDGVNEIGQFVGWGSSADGSATGTRTATINALSQNIGTLISLTPQSQTNPVPQDYGVEQSGIANITVSWPPHILNDIGLLFLESGGGEAANLNQANGFAAMTNSPVSTGSGINGTRLTVYWARSTGTAMAPPIVTDPGDHVYGKIITIRGCITSGDPTDVTSAAIKTAASTVDNFSTMTTTTNNDYILYAASRDDDSAAAAWSNFVNSKSTGDAELTDSGTTQGNGGGVGVYGGYLTTAGTTGGPSLTVTSSLSAMLVISLKPPAVAASNPTIQLRNGRRRERVSGAFDPSL